MICMFSNLNSVENGNRSIYIANGDYWIVANLTEIIDGKSKKMKHKAKIKIKNQAGKIVLFLILPTGGLNKVIGKVEEGMFIAKNNSKILNTTYIGIFKGNNTIEGNVKSISPDGSWLIKGKFKIYPIKK